MMSSVADLQLQDLNLTTKAKYIIYGKRRLIAPEVTEEIGISIGSCHTILMEDLEMHRVCAKTLH
jgi:hypothetical protein